MKKIFLLSMALFLGIFSSVMAQKIRLSGQIIKKEWSKGLDSYCAGGSDDYILRQDNGEEVLLDVSKWSQQRLQRSLGKPIAVRGRWRETTKQAADSWSQQPTTPPLCRFFVLE